MRLFAISFGTYYVYLVIQFWGNYAHIQSLVP